MSQVIVTQDNLSERRQLSRSQEHSIDTHQQFMKWQKSDISGPDPVKKIIGIGVIPVVGLWVILGSIMGAAIGLLRLIFKGLGQLCGGTVDLITGSK